MLVELATRLLYARCYRGKLTVAAGRVNLAGLGSNEFLELLVATITGFENTLTGEMLR